MYYNIDIVYTRMLWRSSGKSLIANLRNDSTNSFQYMSIDTFTILPKVMNRIVITKLSHSHAGTVFTTSMQSGYHINGRLKHITIAKHIIYYSW